VTPNPFDPGYYDEHELSQFGFGCVGHNVRIAKNCTLINLGKIMIGSNVRIDGYTTIVAGPASVEINNFVHIGSSVLIIGGAGVVVGDFCMLSHGARIFTRSDDYSGGAFTNPTVPKMYTNVRVAAVEVRKHAAIGAGSVILPGVTLEEGTAVGALSLVRRSTEPWTIYAGNPAAKIATRKKIDQDVELRLLESLTRAC
jgi:acetyltransferase-like isoleucine patch superfamily enzyme